jgi:co-chaperonin GroES (HSP10)
MTKETMTKDTPPPSAPPWNPVNDVLLIKPLEASIGPSGLILPDTADFGKYEVVAVGQGLYTQDGALVPCTSLKGETVLVPKAAVSQILVDGQRLFMCKDAAVILKVAVEVLDSEDAKAFMRALE